MEQHDLLSYWVVKVYDSTTHNFSDAFSSYGKNHANEKLVEYLSEGICAVIEYRSLLMV